jgi:hypothetical protein
VEELDEDAVQTSSDDELDDLDVQELDGFRDSVGEHLYFGVEATLGGDAEDGMVELDVSEHLYSGVEATLGREDGMVKLEDDVSEQRVQPAEQGMVKLEDDVSERAEAKLKLDDGQAALDAEADEIGNAIGRCGKVLLQHAARMGAAVVVDSDYDDGGVKAAKRSVAAAEEQPTTCRYDSWSSWWKQGNKVWDETSQRWKTQRGTKHRGGAPLQEKRKMAASSPEVTAALARFWSRAWTSGDDAILTKAFGGACMQEWLEARDKVR